MKMTFFLVLDVTWWGFMAQSCPSRKPGDKASAQRTIERRPQAALWYLWSSRHKDRKDSVLLSKPAWSFPGNHS